MSRQTKVKFEERDIPLSALVLFLSIIPPLILLFIFQDLTKEYEIIKPFVDFFIATLRVLFYIVLGFVIILFVTQKLPKKIVYKMPILTKLIDNDDEIAKKKTEQYETEQTIGVASFMFRNFTRVAMAMLVICTELLVYAILTRITNNDGGILLIRDATLLWATNLFLFTVLYWGIDAGGPIARRKNAEKFTADNFHFPEITLKPLNWKPNFFDYFFLASNFSTAFSVTDTIIMSRGAKACVLAQAIISLITLGVIVARGINILNPT